MPSNTFQIEAGVLAFALVDNTAVGYSNGWQAPMGHTLETITAAVYNAPPDSGVYSCQVQDGALNASPNTTDQTRAATFCDPEVTVTQVGVTSYTLDATILQDPHISGGLSRFLFEHDTKEAYFYLGLAGDNPPTAIGRVRIVAGAFGGPARTELTATLSLPVSIKPDIEFGDTGQSTIVQGDGVVIAGGGTPPAAVPATGATAGTPGTWTPANHTTTPANSAAATTAGITASPNTAWTVGQYVQGSTAGAPGEMAWDGTAWVAGRAV